MAKQSLDEMIASSEEAIEKGEDLSDIDADHHGKAKVSPKANKEKIAEKIREAKPNKLYIAIDGPRKDNKFDHEKIKKVLKIFGRIKNYSYIY